MLNVHVEKLVQKFVHPLIEDVDFDRRWFLLHMMAVSHIMCLFGASDVHRFCFKAIESLMSVLTLRLVTLHCLMISHWMKCKLYACDFAKNPSCRPCELLSFSNSAQLICWTMNMLKLHISLASDFDSVM